MSDGAIILLVLGPLVAFVFVCLAFLLVSGRLGGGEHENRPILGERWKLVAFALGVVGVLIAGWLVVSFVGSLPG